MSKYIKYTPTSDNYDFLVDEQAKKNKTGPSIGMARVVDQLITEVRNSRVSGKDLD